MESRSLLISKFFKYRYLFLECIYTCHKRQTSWNDRGNGNVIFLDRHSIDCPSTWALSQVKMEALGSHWNDHNKIRYSYTCCYVNTFQSTHIGNREQNTANTYHPRRKDSG